jgi:uncharacterized membrane protein YqjE
MAHPHEEPASGGSPGLFQSLRTLAATVLEITQTRIELFTTEVQEELHRAAELVLWSTVALLAGSIGTLLLAFCVILAFWEQRLVAAGVVTAVFLLACVVAVAVVRAKLAAYPRPLQSTLAELRRDRRLLERR